MQAREGATGGDEKWLDLAQALTVRPPRRFANRMCWEIERKPSRTAAGRMSLPFTETGKAARRGIRARPGVQSWNRPLRHPVTLLLGQTSSSGQQLPSRASESCGFVTAADRVSENSAPAAASMGAGLARRVPWSIAVLGAADHAALHVCA